MAAEAFGGFGLQRWLLLVPGYLTGLPAAVPAQLAALVLVDSVFAHCTP